MACAHCCRLCLHAWRATCKCTQFRVLADGRQRALRIKRDGDGGTAHCCSHARHFLHWIAARRVLAWHPCPWHGETKAERKTRQTSGDCNSVALKPETQGHTANLPHAHTDYVQLAKSVAIHVLVPLSVITGLPFFPTCPRVSASPTLGLIRSLGPRLRRFRLGNALPFTLLLRLTNAPPCPVTVGPVQTGKRTREPREPCEPCPPCR